MNLTWINIKGNVPSLKNNKEIVSLHTKRKDNEYKLKYDIELPGRKPLTVDLICDRDDNDAAPKIRRLRPILIPSQRHKKYEAASAHLYRNECSKFIYAANGHKRPLKVGFYFIRDSRRIFDYDNSIATCQDIMISRGWIPEDNCEEIMSIPLGHHVDKENAGVWIVVLPDELLSAVVLPGFLKEKQVDMFG